MINEPLSLEQRCKLVLKEKLVLGSKVKAIHYRRALSGRSSIALANLHLLIGSTVHTAAPGQDPPSIMLAHSVSFSSRCIIALSCRKAFDHSASGMTGNAF